MYWNVALEILKVFLNLASEYVLQIVSHHPKFLCSRRHDRNALAPVDVSKIVIKQQTRITDLLLAMALIKNACCNSSFLLLAAWACKENIKVLKRLSAILDSSVIPLVRNIVSSVNAQ